MDLLEKVKRTINSYSMMDRGDGVVVGVSGGVDSVVLLHLLFDLRKIYDLKLYVAHLNHSLRGEESERDEAFVRSLTEGLGLPFFSKRLKKEEICKKGISLQALARELRYGFLEEVRKEVGAGRIALGHNKDDQVETVIMRFLLGSGLKGLRGIPPVRGSIVRPLYEVTRDEILSYAEEKGISYVVDSTNLDTRYLRNRVRLKLIPILKEEFNPGVVDTIFRLSKVFGKEEDLLQEVTSRAFEEVLHSRSEGMLVLSVSSLLSLSPALRARVVREAWRDLTGVDGGLYSYHIEAILELLSSPSPNLSLDLPISVTLLKEYDSLIFRKGPSAFRPYEYPLKIPGVTEIPEAGIMLRAEILSSVEGYSADERVVIFDYERVPRPLLVRNFRKGDRIKPFGMEGTKKLKDLFIDLKIPRSKRRILPLLIGGKEILWVVGIRRSSHAPVTGDTRRVLKVEVVEV